MKKKKHSTTYVALATFLILLMSLQLFSISASEQAGTIRYIKGRPLTEKERADQFSMIPELEVTTESPSVESDLSFSFFSNYPSVLDPRNNNLVSPVKSQGSTQLCWAFSMASIMESALLSQGISLDLSEEHLAYFLANRVNDPLNNTSNDKNQCLNGYTGANNNMIASIFLSTWSGMSTEEEVPFGSASAGLSSNLAYNTSAFLENAVFSEYTIDRTKQLVSEFSSVSALILWKKSASYYNADTGAYSYPISGSGINHAVTIVGWDDTYSKENFAPGANVTSDGAWIVKNSYGTAFGDQGYNYVSYQDKSLTNLVAVTATTSPKYHNNYFYDGSSSIKTLPLAPGESFSTVFQAKAANGKSEALGEIVLASNTDFSSYKIQIYTDLTDPTNPNSGNAVFDTACEYTQALAGIETVTLPKEIILYPGSYYSVVITNADTKAINYFCEKSIAYINSDGTRWYIANASTAAGQGFKKSSSASSWVDLSVSDKYTPRIKARTRSLDVLITPSPTPSPSPTPIPKTYKVTYKLNTTLQTSSLPVDKTKYLSGDRAVIKQGPVCTSRFFAGWNTKADGTGKTYLPGKTLKIQKNITLYAQWKTTYVSSSKLKYKVVGQNRISCYGTSNKNATSITIPNTIKYAGITYKVYNVWHKAFRNNQKLISVKLGNNISVIGNYAFYNCKNLKKVVIGNGLTTIGSHAFCNARNGCVIKIQSTKLKKICSKLDHGTRNMIITVPKNKFSYYRKLFLKTSNSITIQYF